MQDKLLTISVAAFNVEKYIKTTLNSIIDSRAIDLLEILIIDDGGNDGTLNIAREYARKFPNSVYAIHKENGGYGSVINTAISLAKGKYFKQLDGDDWFNKENFITYVDKLKHIDVDFISTPRITIDEITGEKKTTDFLDYMPEGKYFFSETNFKNGIGMHAATFRTDILRNMNRKITEHCFYTDVELVYFPLPLIQTLYVSHTPIYIYRIGVDGQSVSKTGVRKHYKDHEKVFWHILDICNELNPEETSKLNLLRSRLRSEICGQYIYYCMLEINSNHKQEMMTFDSELKNKCPDLLEDVMSYSKYVWLLRKSKFLLYPFMDKLKKIFS